MLVTYCMARSYVVLYYLEPTHTIWMFGHSNHPLSRFLEILEKHEVRCLIDVRTFARSRFPRFNKAPLSSSLSQIGIEYRHAPRLGGRDPLPTVDLRHEVESLLPRKERTCLLCSEGDPQNCHRHTLIAPILLDMGYTVLQILADGSVQEDA